MFEHANCNSLPDTSNSPREYTDSAHKRCENNDLRLHSSNAVAVIKGTSRHQALVGRSCASPMDDVENDRGGSSNVDRKT
ncbi:hypothetical protein Hypma_002002 [Hypsizygus marmoreus]|uniref:Uncharacterized protein n=1 Tax=Hypsizygus marmoreus TaxID=39966 RepID=A0A369J5I1_HYPMA|nr:hypothetical protein Hypma_002002 [Hypsizygus marmoreus]